MAEIDNKKDNKWAALRAEVKEAREFSGYKKPLDIGEVNLSDEEKRTLGQYKIKFEYKDESNPNYRNLVGTMSKSIAKMVIQKKGDDDRRADGHEELEKLIKTSIGVSAEMTVPGVFELERKSAKLMATILHKNDIGFEGAELLARNGPGGQRTV